MWSSIRNKTYIRIPVIYVFFGCIWIVFSDFLFLGPASSWDILTRSSFKGLAFILVTAFFLFLLLYREHRNLKLYEHRLMEQTELHRAVTTASPLALFSLTPEGLVTSWNKAAERIFGWTEKEVMGNTLPLVPPQEHEAFAEFRDRVINGEVFSGRELVRHRKDGSLVEVGLSTAPIRDPQGEITGIMAVMEDISRRMADARQIARFNRLYKIQSAINQAIVRIRDERELFVTACTIAVNDGGFILAQAGVRSKGIFLSVTKADDQAKKENFEVWARAETGPVQDVYLDQQRVSVDDIHEYPSGYWKAAAADIGARSAAFFPVSVRGELRGFFSLYCREPHFFDHDELNLLDELALNLSLGLEVVEGDKQREQMERELKQSESRYRSLFEKNQAVMLLLDPVSGAVVDANPAACTYYGRTRDELRRLHMWDINILGREELLAEIDRAWAGKKQTFLFTHRLADGEQRQVEVFSSPIQVGNRRLLYSLIVDVTARRAAEEALVQAKDAAEEASRVKSEFLGKMSIGSCVVIRSACSRF